MVPVLVGLLGPIRHFVGEAYHER
ncbi:hypothetical protein PCAR4_1000001 [Paraburkholderia caribensis]|nr:hypothetical protein PCAR4_1000001 [Paraburkholderia caribensis]